MHLVRQRRRTGKQKWGWRPAGLPTPQVSGAGEKSRTPDLRITNALLYQLSYTGLAVGCHRGDCRSAQLSMLSLHRVGADQRPGASGQNRIG